MVRLHGTTKVWLASGHKLLGHVGLVLGNIGHVGAVWRLSIHELLFKLVALTGRGRLLQLVDGVKLVADCGGIDEFTVLGWTKVLVYNIVGSVSGRTDGYWWTAGRTTELVGTR